jgi:hypothetical protein
MNPTLRRSSTMTRSGRAVAAAAFVLATAFGCNNPAETLGPGNHVDVTNLVGHFELTADNIQNVTTRMTYAWQNPGVYAAIQHLSFMPHGTTLLIIKDAAGTEVYNGKLLYELDDRTLDGTPGEWTVIFSLDKSVGQIDVILDAAYPPD